MRAKQLGVLWLGVALMGCRNQCQRLCSDIADYAQEECGLEFSDEEVKQCFKDNKRSQLRQYIEDNF